MELIRLDPVFAWVLRTSLAALFATAAIHKMRDPDAFLRTFSEYEILPRRLTAPSAIALVMAELSISVGLLIPLGGYAAELAAVSLLSIYTLAIGLNLLRGRRDIDCGCLGPANRQPLSGWLLLRNGLLVMGGLAICLPMTGRSLHFMDGISLLGGFLTLALLFNAINVLGAQTWRWPEPESLS
jgi:uncharacterized membrane protein YphA (DoxX/SURF4 family)